MNFNSDNEIKLKPHPMPFTLESGPFAGKKIEYAGALELNDYPVEFEKFEQALNEEFGIDCIMASDESSISDFLFDDEDCVILSRKLGVVVSPSDSVVEVLRRMRPVS